jgi:hypothetical protein
MGMVLSMRVFQYTTPKNDPIEQKHIIHRPTHVLVDFNFYMKKYITLFHIVLDELSKMWSLFHQFQEQCHINIKQMNTITSKRSKFKGINFF